MTALPVNLAGVSTDMPRTAFLSSQFGCLFFFTKFRKQRPDRPNDSLMQLLLHLLDDLFALQLHLFGETGRETHDLAQRIRAQQGGIEVWPPSARDS